MLRLALAGLLCLTGCGRGGTTDDSLSSVVADLARLNERVAGALATIEANGDADGQAPGLMLLSEQFAQLAERTGKLPPPSRADVKHIADKFGDVLPNVRRRAQRLAVAIGPDRLGTPAISAALARVAEASAAESKLLASRVEAGPDEVPWYAPLVFHDTVESLGADALDFKLSIATALARVRDQSSALTAGRQLEAQVPTLQAFKSRHKQLGSVSKAVYRRTSESPAQTKADAVIGGHLLRIAQDRTLRGAMPHSLALLADVKAPRLFGRYGYWASRMQPGQQKQPPLAFNPAYRMGLGWGTTILGSGIDQFEEVAESACQQFGEYRVLVMRMTHVGSASSRGLATKLERYAELAVADSSIRHPLCYVGKWQGRAHVLFAPVNDFQALLSAIDFGKVGSVNYEGLTLEVVVHPEKIAEFRDAKDEPPDASK